MRGAISVRELEAELAETHAACAAMRAALEPLAAVEDVRGRDARAALSSTAGRDLLAELERLRMLAQVAGDGVAQADGQIDGLRAEVERLRGERSAMNEHLRLLEDEAVSLREDIAELEAAATAARHQLAAAFGIIRSHASAEHIQHYQRALMLCDAALIAGSVKGKPSP